jgi:hypothetical protein
MRELPYKLELPYEYEYTISIPQGQSGRIKLETIEAYYLDTSDPGNYVATITDICGFVQPDGYTSLELKKNYQRIFREGEWDGWYISRISIRPRCISVVVNRDGLPDTDMELFYIKSVEPGSSLKFNIKALALDGRLETYTVEMKLFDEIDQHGNFLNHHLYYLEVDEPCEVGRRRIVFENGPHFSYETNDGRKVLVFERR